MVTRQPLEDIVVYVVWHPDFGRGEQQALSIFRCLNGLGMSRDGVLLSIPVRARTSSWSGEHGGPPRPLDLTAAARNIVVLLTDRNLLDAAGGQWKDWFDTLKATVEPGRDVVFNVAYSQHANRLPQTKDYQWCDRPASDGQLLIHLLAVIGQHLKAGQKRAGTPPRTADTGYDKEVVFISYVRREASEICAQIRRYVEENHLRVATFLDISDIAHGARYKQVFQSELARCALLALNSDSYSARSWCRWEMLQAKSNRRPIFVANIQSRGEERTFPYGGNLPSRVYRVAGPDGKTLSDGEIERLLLDFMSELVRCHVWELQSEVACGASGLKGFIRLPRPPELADLFLLQNAHPANMPGLTVVYPDPPIDDHERGLLESYLPSVTLKSLSEIRGL